jgi:DNA-binding transcriptional regulator YiaG
MPNLSSLLKSEISRIARKEIKTATSPIHTSTISLKKTISEFKKRIADLEAGNKRQVSDIKPAAQGAVEAIPEDVRITAKSIKTLRLKLGLSQVEFAKLVGISSQNVNVMEHKTGRLKFRGDTLKNILNIKGIGKKEAKLRLTGIGKSNKTVEKKQEKKTPVKTKEARKNKAVKRLEQSVESKAAPVISGNKNLGDIKSV